MNNPYDELREMSVKDICSALGFQALVFVALGLGLWWVSGRPLSTFVTLDFRQVGQGLGLGALMIGFAAALFHTFREMAEKLTRLQARNFAFLEKRLSTRVIVFISACAGIGEEAFFRGGAQTFLGDYVPVAVAIAISSAAFALIHFARPVVAVILFVIGAFLGAVYHFSGSLLTVMIAHWVYDIYAFWFLEKELRRLGLLPNAPADESVAQ